MRSSDGERVLFSADEEEVSIGTERLKVTGTFSQTPVCFLTGSRKNKD